MHSDNNEEEIREQMSHISDIEYDLFFKQGITKENLKIMIHKASNDNPEGMYELSRLYIYHGINNQKGFFWAENAFRKGHQEAREWFEIYSQGEIDDLCGLTFTGEDALECIHDISDSEIQYFNKNDILTAKIKKLSHEALNGDLEAMYQYAKMHWDFKLQIDKCYFWSYQASINHHKKATILCSEIKKALPLRDNVRDIYFDTKTKWNLETALLGIDDAEVLAIFSNYKSSKKRFKNI